MRNEKNYTNRLRAIVEAHRNGYELYRVNEWSYVFKRTTEQQGAVTLNLYWNRKNNFFTVTSAMDHPKQGKTTMTRRFVGLDNAIQLLINPRKHTRKGYKKRRK